MLLETTLIELAKAGGTDIFLSSGANLLRKVKKTKDIKKLFIGTGEFFLGYENNGAALFDDMANVLSNENMVKLANELKEEPGYNLRDKLTNSLLHIMRQYEIPHDIALSYADAILYAIIEQLPEVAPEKYDRVYLASWKSEQEKSFRELNDRIKRITDELAIYQNRQIEILSADAVDMQLRRETKNPSIGFEFFDVDDDVFKTALLEKKHNEVICIKSRCIEEAVYSTINELWKQGEKRPVFLVKNEDDWKRLEQIHSTGNVYVAWFYADQIVAIPNNTNVFFFTERKPSFCKEEIILRPRTYSTIAAALQRFGMGINEAHALVSETHGLYMPMKKKIFNGAYLKEPGWLSALPVRVKETALLVGQWTECEGDKAVIECLSGISYSDFISTIKEFSKDEDPFVHIVDVNSTKEYYLASVENCWDYIDVEIDSEIWKQFQGIFIEVINESEKLFNYSAQEKLMAQFKGERLFWSSIIRKGMIRSLIMKAFYKNDRQCQEKLDILIEKVLDYIQTADQWHYLSHFFADLCEVSPKAVLEKLSLEKSASTGLFELFENQSADFIFGRNDYIEILWGIEELLVQREYAASALEWLLYLDSLSYDYKSNNPKDILNKVFCTWYNFSAFSTSGEKIRVASKAISSDKNAWNIIFEALPTNHPSIWGALNHPQYREHMEERSTDTREMQQTNRGYLKLLISHTEFSPDRWNKMLSIFHEVDDNLRKSIIDRLQFELSQMDDSEKILIKDYIRKLIYKHRYFASAEWAMGEERIEELLGVLDMISVSCPEYDYEYYFRPAYDGVIMDPVPYDEDDKRESNEQKTKELYKSKIQEIKEKHINLKLLSELCAHGDRSTLGSVMSEYWDGINFDKNVFIALFESEEKHIMATDYVEGLARKGVDVFHSVTALSDQIKIPDSYLTTLYRIESVYTEGTPLIDKETTEMKRSFWKDFRWCSIRNMDWAIHECSKYGTVNTYVNLLYSYSRELKPTLEQLYDRFIYIDTMERGNIDSMTDYYLKELLKPLQAAFINDETRSAKLAHVEMNFFYVLDWEDMRCFQQEIKHEPELYAEMASIIFRREGETSQDNLSQENQQLVQVIYRLYDKAKFCPGEEDGHVHYSDLEKWVERFLILLTSNNQKDLFGMLLGRLFAYAPVGEDGYYPCEEVREIIEKVADKSLLEEYECELFNKRGLFTPTAGREERDMANDYLKTADYLCTLYPKTAEIFYAMYRRYTHDSEWERKRAENGLF